MTVDAERMWRAALDEPAPPPPEDPADEDEGDDGYQPQMPRLVFGLFSNGDVVAANKGVLLCVWLTVGTLATGYVVAGWAWALLTSLNAGQVMAQVAGATLWFAIWLGALQWLWPSKWRAKQQPAQATEGERRG